MNLGEVIKAAWNSLMSNKSRSFLTMLGVIIGVAAVIVMISISAGTEASIAEKINGLGSNLIFINSAIMRGGPGAPGSIQGGLKSEDVTVIRDTIPGIAGVSVEQQASATLKYSNVSLESVTIVGTTPDYTTVRNVAVGSGRWFSADEVNRATKVVVLGSTVATKLFGDADPLGETINAGNVKLAVIGVLAPKGLSSGTNFDDQVYTPIQVVFKKFTPSRMAKIMGENVRAIYVSVESSANMDDVVSQITQLLLKRHNVTIDTQDFNIQTQADIIKTQEATTSSFRTLLAWVAGVSLIVGGIGIMNIMLVSVTERTREIGLRQAIGATPSDIQVQFLSEALMLSLLGGLLGVLTGIGGAILFGKFGGMRTVIVPYSIILSFTSAALVGIFFGYIPAQTAAKLDPIVALRHD